MSIHGLKSKSRHPDAERIACEVDHITFELNPKNGTYGLVPGLAETAKERRAFFTGFLSREMADQMRAAADEIERALEAGHD